MDQKATAELAKFIIKNDKMKLKEFIAFRNKLRNGGVEAMADVFEK
jgi:hypothetical protein